MDFTHFTILNGLELSGWVVAGGLAVVGVFNKQRRTTRAEDDTVASNLIKNLTTTTELQEKEILVLRAREIEQGKDIAHMQGQIKVLTEILQGRDPAMQQFLENAPQLQRIADENNQLAKETAKRVADLAEKSITDLANSVKMLVILLTPKN